VGWVKQLTPRDIGFCRGSTKFAEVNARFHTAKGSRLVRQYLAEHGDRIVLHYLPARSPQDNPIERVWWHLHEQSTRNHPCQGIEELVKLTIAWLDEDGALEIEGRMYEPLRAAA